MRTLAGAIVLLTLTNLSLAAEAVVAHIEVLEISHTRLRAFGIDFDWPRTQTTVSAQGGATFSVFEPSSPLLATLEQWKSVGAVRVLGSPTLMTVSGRPASFHAGGEVAIPKPGPMGQRTVDHRKIGLEVELLPEIKASGMISTDLLCRYTDPQRGQSVRANGFIIPALLTREVNTGCELKPGQTLAIRGWIQTRQEPFCQMDRRGRRVVQSKANEVEMVVLLRLELAVTANSGEASQQVR